MGGLHSGRKRQHTCCDDCLVLDLAWLKKQKMLGKGTYSVTWKKWTETNFITRKEHTYAIGLIVTRQAVTLSYATSIQGEEKEHAQQHTIDLTTTPCNYGGFRLWFVAPCCGQRVRVLYLNTKTTSAALVAPMCRICAELHYPSQMASYIERHKTYERHLLANYGLYWAEHRYNFEMKEHYLEMTPELWALRLKSVYDWNMHLLKEIIKCDLMIYRADLRNLRSIRDAEEKQEYIKHMHSRQGNDAGRDLVRIFQQSIAYERLLYEINTRDMDEHLFDIYAQLAHLGETTEQAAKSVNFTDLPVEAVEQKIIDLEAMLKQVNKASQKKAA